MKIVAIDLGNTRAKMALMLEGNIIDIIFESSQTIHQSLHRWLQANKVEAIIVCTVVSIPEDLNMAIQEVDQVLFVSHEMALPFKSEYTTMDTLGRDRLALVAAAVHKFPNQSSLVIALGTCITYNFVNQDHVFLGGGIAPGLQMRLKAMQHFTQKLPLVDVVANPELVGNSTMASMQSGAINGMLAEIEGVIAAYEAKYGKINVVLTGGDMPQFESRIKKQIFAHANFLFEGLYALLLHHSKPK